MRPNLTVLTLAVEDLERATAFYRDGLGWSTKGIVGAEIENGAVAFFRLESGLLLGLWPRTSLLADARLPNDLLKGGAAFSLGHNVGSKAEVDEAIAAALRAGGTVVEPPQDRAWGGYSGYFQDLDGHLWDVAWNPNLDDLG